MKLKNKVALITGSSRGIGKAIALLFAEEGAKIIVNYNKSKKEAEAVVKKVESLGSQAIVVKCDVSKEKEVIKMVDEAIKEFGKIDILVNNAGVIFDNDFKDKTIEHWKKTLEVNLIGTFICSKIVSEVMKKQSSGNIVNISSTNGTDAVDPGSIEYGSSKAGVIYFTRALAKELSPNIRVNTVAPGWVDTDMNKDLPKDYIDEEMKKIFLGRMADPKEIAKAVLFFSTNDSSYITGTILKVDGGHS